MAGEFNREKSIFPSPEKVKDDVVSSSSLGKRKTRVQVLPASAAGISKLKMDDMLEVTSPKKDVPAALSGFDLSTETMR